MIIFNLFKNTQIEILRSVRLIDLNEKIKKLNNDYHLISSLLDFADQQTQKAKTALQILRQYTSKCRYLQALAEENFIKANEIVQTALKSINESKNAFELQRGHYISLLCRRSTATPSSTSTSASHTPMPLPQNHTSPQFPPLLPNLSTRQPTLSTSTQFNSTPSPMIPSYQAPQYTSPTAPSTSSPSTTPLFPLDSLPSINSSRITTLSSSSFSQTTTHPSSLSLPPLHTPTPATTQHTVPLQQTNHLSHTLNDLPLPASKPAAPQLLPQIQMHNDITQVISIIRKNYDAYQKKIKNTDSLIERDRLVTEFLEKLNKFVSTRNLAKLELRKVYAFVNKLPPFALE